MVVDGVTEVGVGSAVDEADAVLSASGEGGFESRADDCSIVLGPGVCAVDQTVVALYIESD